MSLFKSIINEYGLTWVINRTLYSLKLRLLASIPWAERLFEHNNICVKQIDLFEINTELIQHFLPKLPMETQEELIKEADDITKGIIKGFSSIKLDYGNPIDWQLNPITQRKCDHNTKWYRIPDFEEERGDIKVVWEASRFSHFLTLLRAYLLTKEQKFYEAYSQQLDDWIEKNPYSFGANYKCGQECAIRMMNGLIAYSAFNFIGIATGKDKENTYKLVNRCYRKILSNFFYAYKCIKNNHTISELTGMIIGAWCCNDKKREKKAYSQLNKVILEQFYEDGGYKQFSFNYQRLALQDIAYLLSIENKTNGSITAEAKTRIKKSAYLLFQVQNDKDGDVPNYGANDGALIFPVTSCKYRDFRPIINTIFSLVDNKRVYPNGPWDEELLWFSNGIEKYQQIHIIKESKAFINAGLYCFRNKRAFLMIVLNNYKSRPGHMDQMHLDLWIDGMNVLCDSGTFSYADKIGKTMASTAGHNTVIVSEKEQMNKRGPFMITDWTKSEVELYSKDKFVGTVCSRNGYSHKRIVNMDEKSIEIIDTIIGQMDQWKQLFHTPYEVRRKSNSIELFYDEKKLCEMDAMRQILRVKKRSVFYLITEPCNVVTINNKEMTNSVVIHYC